MAYSRRQLLVTASAAALAAAGSSAGARSLGAPIWGQFKGDARRTGRSDLAAPGHEHVRWKSVHSMQSPMSVDADGRVYFGGDDGIVFAHSAAGELLWGRPLGGGYITAGTAILRDGSILVVPEQAAATCFWPDGEQRWRFRLGDYSGPPSAPLEASDGTIYIGNSSRLVALRPNGSLKWSYDVWVNGPPAEGLDGSIIFPSYQKLLALSPKGKLRWAVDSGIAWYDRLSSAPAVADDGTIYVNSLGGRLLSVAANGSRRGLVGRKGKMCDVASSPAIGRDGTIYFASSYRDINAVSPDGALLWTTPTAEGDSFSALTLDADDTIYFGAATGRVHAMSSQGVPLWYRFLGNRDPYYYVRSAPVVLPGRQMLVGTYDGVFVIG